MRHGLGRHRSHAEQQGPHSTQTVSVSLLIYSTRFPFAFFFCRHDSSVGAESHQLWPPSQKVRAGLWELCQGRFPGFFDPLPKADRAISAVAVAARWPSYDFLSIFSSKNVYLFIPAEKNVNSCRYHRPRSTFFLSLSYPPISGSDCGSVTSPLYYFLFSFLLVVVVVFVHINQLHRHITMDANRGRVE